MLQVVDFKGGIGRGERIRTSGLYVPNVALYRAKLHPDWFETSGRRLGKHYYNFPQWFLSTAKRHSWSRLSL
jgi:hypothetical protein